MKLRETQADLLKRCFGKLLNEGFKKIEDNMNQDFRKSRLSKEDIGSERDTFLDPVTGTNLHVTRPAHQRSTVEQKCRGVCDKNSFDVESNPS